MAGGRVLVLIRPARGEVRLPKGKPDPGETPEQTALREVAEESGFSSLEIVADLGEGASEYDTLDTDGAPMHVTRDERYFLMRLTAPDRVDRPEEDADQFIPDWREPDQAIETLTYEGEKDWVRRALTAAQG